MTKVSINAVIGANTKAFDTKMQKVLRTVKKVGSKLKSVGKSITRNLTLPILAIGAAAIKFASDLQESIGKADVAFGQASKSVKDFAKTTLRAFGVSEGAALDMASTFGDMATSMGIAKRSAANMSISLVGLAGDLASFKNIGIDQAQTALKGIFTGETESLKTLGIVMTQANLKAFALSKGLDGNILAMTEAQKVTLRYSFILDKTKNAQGDFTRTGGNAAGQMRVFQETLKELAASFGQVVLPAFTKMLKKINNFLDVLRRIKPEVKKTIAIIALVAAAIGPLIFAVGALSTAFAFLAANPIVLIITGITIAVALLAAGIIFVVQNWERLTDELKGERLRNNLVDLAKFIVKVLTLPFQVILKSINAVLGALNLKKIKFDLFEFSDELLNKLKVPVTSATKEWKSFGEIVDDVKKKIKGADVVDITTPGTGKGSKQKLIKSDILQSGIFFGIRQFRKETEKSTLSTARFRDELEDLPFSPVNDQIKETALTMQKFNTGVTTFAKQNPLVTFFDDARISAELMVSFVKQALRDLISSSIEIFAETLGQAAAGVEGAFDNLGQNLLSNIGGFMQELGKAIIQIALAEIAFSTLLKTAGTGFGAVAAIAAGAALIAIGAGIKSQMGDKGVQGFFQGGVVQGPSGRDRVPIMATAGELILTEAQQRNLVGKLGRGAVVLDTRVDGGDLMLVQSRTQRADERRRG